MDLTYDCFYKKKLVHKPTRGKNILDLVFTTEQNMDENIEINEHFCNSGHNITSRELVLESK